MIPLSSHLGNCREQLRTMWSAVGQFLEEEFLFIFTCLDLLLRPAYHLLYYVQAMIMCVCAHYLTSLHSKCCTAGRAVEDGG